MLQIGSWTLGLGLVMLLPLAVALVSGEGRAISGFTGGVTLTLLIGGSMVLGFRGARMQRLPVLTVLLPLFGCLLLAMVAGLPLYLIHDRLDLAGAFFDGMALVTTHGASSLAGIGPDAMPGTAERLWRALVGWLGGFAAITLALSFLTVINSGGVQLRRSPLPFGDTMAGYPRLRAAARHLAPLYAGVTALTVLLLLLAGMAPERALLTALSAVSTTGLDWAAPLADDGVFVAVVVSAVMLLAVSNWDMLYVMLSGHRRGRRDQERRTLAVSVLAGTALLLLAGGAVSMPDVARALFKVISAISTTGWMPPGAAPAGQDYLPVALVLMALAAIGGAVTGTGGGLRQMRLYLVLRLAFSELNRLAHPSGIHRLHYDQNEVEPGDSGAVWLLIGGFILAFVTGTLALGMFGVHFQDAILLSFSALTLSGPLVAGIDPGFVGFDGLTAPDHVILGVLMMVGRLEASLVLALFARALWRS
ncbi:potassium transporter TrkG [Yunchengibacter salinarum]|uniref:potassium transporter TrkG n=1 Tax=Yunchengibacter salinarum TaxID=3133399 RepID=UPI0035B69796